MKKRGRGWTLLIVVVLFGCTGLFLWRTGFFEAVSSLESLRRYLEEAAPFGQLFFFLLQLASVVLAPIPNNIVALAGAVLILGGVYAAEKGGGTKPKNDAYDE